MTAFTQDNIQKPLHEIFNQSHRAIMDRYPDIDAARHHLALADINENALQVFLHHSREIPEDQAYRLPVLADKIILDAYLIALKAAMPKQITGPKRCRPSYKDAYRDITGWRDSRRNRKNGAVYSLYDAAVEPNWLDDDGGRWVTMCEKHSTLVNHETYGLAVWHLPEGDWCEECQKENA